jgi:hypothetical protein
MRAARKLPLFALSLIGSFVMQSVADPVNGE